MSTPTHIFADREALMNGAAELLILASKNAIVNHGRWMWVLAGGSTPKALYETLAKRPRRDRIDWSKTWIFWGDERAVGPEDAQSNYRMAKEALLNHVPIPHSQIFRIYGEHEPAQAAQEYEQTLREVFELTEGQRPSFDTLLLGMGEDGHTASLFPQTDLLKETSQLVTAGWVAQQQQDRISLTLPVLNAARGVMFLVAGADKAAMVKLVVQRHAQDYPAALVQPAIPALWLLDGAAASLLD